jgi:hypothetical protein
VDIVGEVVGDPGDALTDYQLWAICQKCQLLFCVLNIAREKMPIVQNWDHICLEGLEAAKRVWISITKASQIVRNYYQDFRLRRKFQFRILGGDNLPPFLEQNKDVCTTMQQYAREHLSELSVELMCEYLDKTVLPKMVKEWTGIEKGEFDTEEYEIEVEKLLQEYRLTSINPSTVYRWLRKLRFKYETRRKGYYVDGHEKPRTIEYRKQFVTRYLQYERRAHRWIQITVSEAQELEQRGFIKGDSGYRYEDAKGKQMVELHVDTCNILEERANNETKYGRKLSVRKAQDEKPLIMFGHDECIFKQCTMKIKSWKAPNGAVVLIPKDDVQGVMISAFQSREFRLGLQLNQEQLALINQHRNNKDYCYEKAAIKLRGTSKKQALTETPFIREFEYGQNSDGYWSYEHMVLQMEDCIDVMKVLHPEVDVLLLFDHSCGHDGQ